MARYLFGSAARPIFAEVKQRRWSAEERGVSYCFCEGRESGESGHFSYSSEKSASFFFGSIKSTQYGILGAAEWS